MRSLLAILWPLACWPAIAAAQSVPNGGTITQGQTWTVQQWIAAWQAKQDVLTLPLSQTQGGSGAASLGAGAVTATGTSAPNTLASRFARVVYAADEGVKCDGTTDNAADINAAIVLAGPGSSGQGLVQLPSGVCIVGSTVVLQTGVVLNGNGRDATIIRAEAGTTMAVIQTANFATLTGTNTAGGPYQWGLENLTIDGNKANRSGTTTSASFYGYDFDVINVNFENATGSGAYSEWATSGTVPVSAGGNSMESHWVRTKFFSNTVDGLDFNGPHDSAFADTLTFLNGHYGAAFGAGANYTAGGTFLNTFHSYGNANIGLVVGAQLYINAIESESNTSGGGVETTSTGSMIGSNVVTYGNTGDGVDLFATGSAVSGLSATGNTGTGLSVTANSNAVTGYVLSSNTTANLNVSGGNTSVLSLGVVAGAFNGISSGVSCAAGSPSSSFTVTGGVVVHC